MHQIISHTRSVPPELTAGYDDRELNHGLSPSFSLLSRSLRKWVASRHAVYVFIDGLDELLPTEAERLLKFLTQIRDWLQPSVHIFVASQFHALRIRPRMLALTSAETRLDLEYFNKGDIKVYILQKLDEPFFKDRWSGKEGVLREIEDELIAGSQRSYVDIYAHHRW